MLRLRSEFSMNSVGVGDSADGKRVRDGGALASIFESRLNIRHLRKRM
ncbi:hypothetical protein [Nostoc sp.]